jgi:hypothetical protein
VYDDFREEIMISVEVSDGDILHEPADAMIMPISPDAKWLGQINSVQSTAKMFEGPLRERESLVNLDVIVLPTPNNFAPGFLRVICVVDDHTSSPAAVVNFGLTRAEKLGLRTVTLPPADWSLRLMMVGIRNFKLRQPVSVQTVKVMVHHDYPTFIALRALADRLDAGALA